MLCTDTRMEPAGTDQEKHADQRASRWVTYAQSYGLTGWVKTQWGLQRLKIRRKAEWWDTRQQSPGTIEEDGFKPPNRYAYSFKLFISHFPSALRFRFLYAYTACL